MVMAQDVIPICQTLLCYFGGERPGEGKPASRLEQSHR